MLRSILLLLLVIISTSCAQVQHKKMKEDITKRLMDIFETTTGEISDGQIASVADRKALLPKDFNLAVHFKKPVNEDWSWTQNDRREILSTIRAKEKKIGKAFELINTGREDEELKSLRMMAAQQGADALLVIQGASEVNGPPNGMALTYVALVPMLFVNGNTVKSAFVTQAVLWDVRTSNVHLGAKSEGEYSMKRPLAFRQKDRAVEKAKDEAMKDLNEQLNREFGDLEISSNSQSQEKGKRGLLEGLGL